MFGRDDVADAIPPRFEGHADRLTYLAGEYRAGIYVALLALIALGATGYLSVEIPPWATIALSGLALGILPSIAVGKVLADRWLPDPRVRVIEIKTDPTPSIEPHRIPRDLWDRRDVIDLPVWRVSEGATDAIVTSLEHLEDVGRLKVRGVNPELADPTSIAARDGQLSAVFGELQEAARDLNAQRGTEGLRQIEMEERIINEVIRSVEQGTSLKPGAFEEIVRGNDVEESDRPRSDEIEDNQTLGDLLGPDTQPAAAATDGGIYDE